MLSHLSIHDLAIVTRQELDFESGLSVLSGETGAGKSVVVRALALLSGAKGRADFVRSGAKRTVIEAIFSVPKWKVTEIRELLSDLEEIEIEDELILRRVLDANGRSRYYVNNQLLTQSCFISLSSQLLGITGQHDNQILWKSTEHRKLLDDYLGFGSQVERVTEAFRAWSKARQRLDEFISFNSERNEYLRRISFEHEELTAFSLKDGERSELEQEQSVLGAVEFLGEIINQTLAQLDQDGQGAGPALQSALRLLTQAKERDRRLEAPAKLLESAFYSLDEARLSLSAYGENLESNPTRLEEVRQRIAEIARLERKYQKSETELVQYFKQIDQELAAVLTGKDSEEELRKQVERCEHERVLAENELSSARKAGALEFEKSVKQGLRALGMKGARLKVEISQQGPSPYGVDDVCFHFSANAGEEPKPLMKVASGGEMSRLLLVLKTLITKRNGPLVQVFDEIDTGVGGVAADAVGEKLKQLSKGTQVIVVTHLAQIAALADHHFRVLKTEARDTTSVDVSVLSPDDRVDEVARMLAGKKISDQIRQSARELLRS